MSDDIYEMAGVSDQPDYCYAADVFDPKYCQWKGGPKCSSPICREVVSRGDK